jgi:hypothetical protein
LILIALLAAHIVLVKVSLLISAWGHNRLYLEVAAHQGCAYITPWGALWDQ